MIVVSLPVFEQGIVTVINDGVRFTIRKNVNYFSRSSLIFGNCSLVISPFAYRTLRLSIGVFWTSPAFCPLNGIRDAVSCHVIHDGLPVGRVGTVMSRVCRELSGFSLVCPELMEQCKKNSPNDGIILLPVKPLVLKAGYITPGPDRPGTLAGPVKPDGEQNAIPLPVLTNSAGKFLQAEMCMVFSLTTERLVLDDLTGQDLLNIQRVARDPGVMRYVLIWLENDEQVAGFLLNAIDEAQRQDRRGYVLAVRIPGTHEFAGFAMLEIDPGQESTAEVGYILLPDYWKNGYASEILRALLAFGFGELGLHRVYGKCDELNLPSVHVMEKCGLQYEGTLREHVWLRDHWRSTRYFGMLAGEYFSQVRLSSTKFRSCR